MALSTEPARSVLPQQSLDVPVGRKEDIFAPPRDCVTSSLERLFRRMRDASNTARDGPLPDNQTAQSATSRSLRRTKSRASLDTIGATSAKGVRRRIDQMGPNATHKNKLPSKNSRENSPECTESESSPVRKVTKKERKALRKLQATSDQTEEENISDITARLLQTAPTAAWALEPSSFACPTEAILSMVTKPSSKEDEQPRQDCSFPTRNLKPGAHIDDEPDTTSQLPHIATIGMNDISLVIRPYEPDVTIWDGQITTHHIFKCHLFLRCTAQPFDVLSSPDIQCMEIICTTLPVGRVYANASTSALRPTQRLQTTYKGSRVELPTLPTDKPAEIDPKDGIHVSRPWRAMMDGDGTWGWYVAAFVPIPTGLFAKIEYRRFELVVKVRVGEYVVEGALSFGMTMLFREVDMK